MTDFSNNTLCVKGDSIVLGAGNDDVSWVDMIAATGRFRAVRKYGTHGMPVCSVAGRNSILETISEIAIGDITIIAGGVNDFAQSAPLGTWDSDDPETFRGALSGIAKEILTKHPTTSLCFATPVKITCKYGDWNRPNRAGHVMADYVKAIRELCENYSFPCFDAYSVMGFQPLLPSLKDAFQPDGVHPNQAGYERYARKILAFLEQYA